MRSGDLFLEVSSSNQATILAKLQKLVHLDVNVSPHGSLNFSRGVISPADLLNVSSEEILENLQDQKVCGVRRITIRRDGQKSVLAPQTPKPLLTWRTDTGRRFGIRVFLLLCISFSLAPTQRRPVRHGRPYMSSKVTTDIALWLAGAHKPTHHDKVEIPASGFEFFHVIQMSVQQTALREKWKCSYLDTETDTDFRRLNLKRVRIHSQT
ncbi:uncharacterized protein TNCT_443551 [Trichonephila clavata]|uniref:Uncharacterized protein n=1 Tax=Trichonephila clavata TaxID=2740835 RepID=A0A8X6IIP3_TRICU|nr:uncharacterized protein TNCT_443551 [Trichonephila clavata]